MQMNNLSPEDEVIHAHHYYRMQKWVFGFFVVVFSWMLMTLYIGRIDNTIPWENCNPNWTMPAARAMNPTHMMVEKKNVKKFTSEYRMKRRLGFFRIQYGTTHRSYCKHDSTSYCDNDMEELILHRRDNSLKSILRVIELNPYVSSAIRFVILTTIVFRAVQTIIRVADFLVCSRTRLHPVCSWMFCSTPFVVVAQSILAFLSVATTIEFDKPMHAVHPYFLIGFGFCTSLYMFLELLQDAVDSRIKVLTQPSFYLRCGYLLVFSLSFPSVIVAWLPFYTVKMCTPYVNWNVAALEHLCAMSILLFEFSRVFLDLHLYLTPTKNELQDFSSFETDVYMPAYMVEHQAEYEKIPSKQ